MLGKSKFLVFLLFSLLLVTGCASEQSTGGEVQLDDNYHEAREVAWDYVQEMGWGETLDAEAWETAKVETITGPEYYDYTKTDFIGEEVLLVIFPVEGQPVASVTHFLVDKEMDEVVGYLEGA